MIIELPQKPLNRLHSAPHNEKLCSKWVVIQAKAEYFENEMDKAQKPGLWKYITEKNLRDRFHALQTIKLRKRYI